MMSTSRWKKTNNLKKLRLFVVKKKKEKKKFNISKRPKSRLNFNENIFHVASGPHSSTRIYFVIQGILYAFM